VTGVELLAAVVAAGAVGLLARRVLRPPRRLAPRLAPYSERVRARLGTTVPHRVQGPVSVWGPLVSALANGLSNVIDANRADESVLRLRQAGMRISVEDYRRRQLGYTVAAFTAGFLVALVLRLSMGATLLVMVAAGMVGLTRWRSMVDRRIARRRATMRAETHTICQLLAVYLRTGDTPIGALERLVERTSGVVSDELTAAAALIRSGSPAAAVLERLATDCAEPSTGRLYRLYGATWAASGDPDALLALAEDLRSARREDLARTMAKRRTAMTVPLVLILGPILILFIAAPLPSLIFGR
jgi:tight adherence protein C